MSEVFKTVHLKSLKSKIVILHKYLNDEQKYFCLLQFFPDVAQKSLMILRLFEHVQRNPEVFQVFPVYDHALPNQAITVLIIWNSNFDQS